MTWSAEQPGSRLVNDVQTEVCRYIQYPEDTEILAVAYEGIRGAIAELNGRRWRFLLASQYVTFAADTNEYELEEPFREPRHFALINSGGQDVGRLLFAPWKTFALDQAFENTGDPCYYSVKNSFGDGTVTISAKPGASWVGQYPTGRLDYFANLLVPQPSDPLGVPQRFESYVMWYAKMHTAASIATSKRDFARSMAADILEKLKVQDNKAALSDWD